MSVRYVLGQPVVLDATFTVASVATDPPTVTLVVTDPTGTASTYTYAGSTITKSSTGVYTKTVTGSIVGDWSYVWTGTGTAADVQDGTFHIYPAAPIVTNYCTLDQLRAEKALTDTVDDVVLATAIAAASRQIDHYCGQRFWLDATPVAYELMPDSATVCRLDDVETLLPGVATLTGLVVKADIDLDGTYETTLTINTDFLVQPRNALAMNPARPVTSLTIVPIGSQMFFPQPRYGRASMQVTGRFGWPAVPDDVTKACLIQAAMLAKAKDAPFGGVELGQTGAAMFVRSRLHAFAEGLLSSYQKPAVG